MYNTKYICNYQATDIFFETDVVTEEEKDFIKNAIYRNDFLYIFNIDDFVEDEINRCIKDLHDKLHDCKELNELMSFLASKYGSIDKEFGLMLLFSYDFLYLTHPCICDFLENGIISKEKILFLNTEINLKQD
jgi:hypothetical protein